MNRRLVLALCAAVAAVTVPAVAGAQGAAPPSPEGTSATSQTKAPSAKKHAARPARARNGAGTMAPAAPTGAYELVPRSSSSAQTRARQGSFGTPDDDAGPSGSRGGRMGIGLGGSNGTTPGMQMGF